MESAPHRRHSYGIVPLFKEGGEIEVLLILQSRLGPKVWGFPKGTPKEGEPPIETAIRETKEEVGCDTIELISDFAHTESYVFTEADGLEVHKQVTYFAGYLETKDVLVQESEVDGYEWLSFGEARKRLTHSETKEVLTALIQRLHISSL